MESTRQGKIQWSGNPDGDGRGRATVYMLRIDVERYLAAGQADSPGAS
jgi:hypothetical protein